MRRVENAQRCPDGGSARAPLISCPPVNAGYVATRRLAETLRKAAAVAGVSDVYVSRVALRQGPFRNEGAALLKFLRNGSLTTVASASADVPGAPDPYVASLVEQEMCERAAASAEINQCVRPASRYYLLFWPPRRSARVLGVLARGVLGLLTRTFDFRTGGRSPRRATVGGARACSRTARRSS